MLQYITQNSTQYSVLEQIQMAVEGGCAWVIISRSSVPGGDNELRDIVTEAIPLCKEAEVILTLENHVAMAQETHVHGVLLTNTETSAKAAREQLGPEAIIGAIASTPQAIIMLKGLDIDYALLPPGVTIDQARTLVTAVRDSACPLPIVAQGNIPLHEVQPWLEAGVNGIAIGENILQYTDPVEAMRKYLAATGA